MPDTAPKPPQSLSEALAALQAHLPRVAKDQEAKVTSQRTGKTHSYKYADLADVSEVILPLMAALGLAFTCCPTMDEHDRFVLRYQLLHVSGGNMMGEYPLPGSGSPQEIGSAITYARRYALCAVTGLAPGGDDDDAAAGVTDEQRQAAEVMTSEQAREHGKLRKLDHPRPADRSTGPTEGDPWTDQPAGKLPPMEVEDQPGSSNGRQHQRLGILYQQIGITDRDDRLTDVANRVQRKVASAKDLSYVEAEEIIAQLSDMTAKAAN